MSSKPEGSYITRGRGVELERMIAENRRDTERKLADLDARLKLVSGFPLELAKRISAAIYDAVREFSERKGPA